ncbi:MAG TPA: precorrin-2 C(20)-methyltransferase [Stellaceae bacterium]|nr:precorrin-2 C(20)-methyltransferase [Stellaceae bacterium]
MSGTLYGLGVGPGDPELVTVKALRVLRGLPVVAYPAPSDGASFARSVVASRLSPAQTEIAIRVPMTRSVAPAQPVYDRAALEIGEHLRAGRDVGVLCQGDPFFYGSFIQLFERLATEFPTKVVPGVSSLTACAAAAGVPLVTRDEILTVLPATLAEAALEKRLKQAEAAAILKLGRHLPKVRRILKRLGLADRATYVEHASLESQKILALEDVDPASAPYFSMVLVRRADRDTR